jgi:LL-diaminopimelate aminotransferase
VNYPNMPTGAKATKELFKQLVNFGLENQILVCNDNPYSHILNDNPLSIMNEDRAKETCLELNSLSKSHNMQGFRVGMVGGHKQLLQALIKVKSNYDSGMYLAVQEAAIEALSLEKEWYDKNNKIYQERKDLLREVLCNLGLSFDQESQGMFLWCEIPKSFNSGYEYSDHLLNKYKVFAAPGGIFGSNGNNYIRFSLCSGLEQINELGKRIKKLKKIAG